MDPRTVSLLIADDHPLVLAGLRQVLGAEPRFSIVAVCSDGASTIDSIRRCRPDVALVDVTMPILNGLEILSAVSAEGLMTRIILISASLRDSEIGAAIEVGVCGLLTKGDLPDVVVSCVARVAAGGTWLPAEVVDGAVKRTEQRRRKSRAIRHLLTIREQDVFLLAANDLSNKDMALRLGIAEGTVKIHLHKIYEKLKIRNRAELATLARSIKDPC